MLENEMLLVGQINSIFAVKGWVKIFSYTDNKKDICQYSPIYHTIDNQFQPLEIEDIKPQSKTIIAKIKSIDTPAQAQLLCGKKLYIHQKQRPHLKKNEYYWTDLIGLKAINQSGVVLGVVKCLLNAGAHDILVIYSNGVDRLVPYVPNYVLQIDLIQKTIQLDWEQDF